MLSLKIVIKACLCKTVINTAKVVYVFVCVSLCVYVCVFMCVCVCECECVVFVVVWWCFCGGVFKDRHQRLPKVPLK